MHLVFLGLEEKKGETYILLVATQEDCGGPEMDVLKTVEVHSSVLKKMFTFEDDDALLQEIDGKEMRVSMLGNISYILLL